MMVNSVSPAASPISNGNGGGQRSPRICDHCDEELGIPNVRDVNVHAEGIYIFKTPGTYDVTIRQQQLAPNPIWPLQQAQMLQAVPPGNPFGPNGQHAGAHQTPLNFAGGQTSFGGLGAAQYAVRGGNGMTFAQPRLPITANGQPVHTPSSFSTVSSAPEFPMFSPQNLSSPDNGFDNSSLSPLSE